MSVAVVTGGGRGIGLAIAEVLRGRGSDVIIVGRDRERLEAAAAKLSARALVCDLLDRASVTGLIAELSQVDGLDVLVNNAGAGGSSTRSPTPASRAGMRQSR